LHPAPDNESFFNTLGCEKSQTEYNVKPEVKFEADFEKESKTAYFELTHFEDSFSDSV
jgi:hypothetical protein